jgi:hypothetical protein
MSYYKKGDRWPPTKEDDERIKKYQENEKLFRGEHADVFKKVQQQLDADEKALTYLVVNYCGLLSRLSADMLFGEHPKITAQNDNTNKGIENIIDNNNLYTSLYESALGNSFRGDSCLKVRYGKRSKYKTELEPIISVHNPSLFFVEQSPDDIRQVDRQVVGWIIEEEDKSWDRLRLEVHEPGIIYNYLYRISGGVIQFEEEIRKVYPDKTEEQETGVDGFLIQHIPNWRTDTDFWGISDYVDIKPLQDEANNRISQIARVLDKHAEPKMKGPSEALDDNNKIEVSGSKYFPYSKESVEPNYFTWEAKLEAAFKEVDYLLKMMFLVTETSPDAFGLSENNIAESGRALKYRLMRLLAKISRKKIYYDEGIKKALYVAQALESNNSSSYKPETPTITWRDGLPDDEVETASITESLERSGSISVEESVRKNNPNWGEDRIKKEIARIEARKAVDSNQNPVL